MNRTTVILILVASCLLLPVMTAVAAPDDAKRTTYALIRCESPGGQDSFCPIDTRRGVRLVNTLHGRCRLGRSWGYDEQGIWVRGCSAEFEIGVRGTDYGYGWDYADGDIVTCASDRRRYRLCATPTRGGVRLLNQISRAECVQGRTWGWDQRGIWVDQGCAGEFALSAGAHYRDDYPISGLAGATGSTFVCESRDGRRRQCDVDLSGRAVTVIRNISRIACAEGDTWGYSGRTIWVDGGCRAEFRIIAIERSRGGPIHHPVDPYQRQRRTDDHAVEYVSCESRGYEFTRCAIGRVRQVQLYRQTSSSPCTRGRSWDFDGASIWVDAGCAAQFEIQR